ncbi:Glycosyl transferase family 2 [Gaiella occulta]|uniref:Glycosyl transferase family 2 n=2 Tax=Gaiella occulta TaxID=1002870 RepID=A0A7M2Z0Z1_9ACTN|nr:Glycosyl transferase family 2 [Gaiella occulta]
MLVTSGFGWPHAPLEEAVGRALAQRRAAAGLLELERCLDAAAARKLREGSLSSTDSAAARFLAFVDEAVAAHAPDVALVFHGRLFPSFAVQRLRACGVFPVLWTCEDPYELDWSLEVSASYGAVATIERSCAPVYEAGGTPCLYLPLGYDPYVFRPRADVPPEYRSDVCVLGSAFPRRLEVLAGLAPALAGLDVRIVGRWWERLPRELHRFVDDRIVGPEEAALFYAGAALNLNVHRDSVEASFSNRTGVVGRSLNNRTFEIAGAGGFQVVDPERDERGSFFSERSVGVLGDRMLELLDDREALRERGRAAAAEAAGRHTYAHRMDMLLQALAGWDVRRRASGVHVPAALPAAAPGLTSIVILTRNQLRYTRECVESIERHTPEPHDLVFVDNGSSDGTLEYLRGLSGATVIENGANLGFAIGCNQGALRARGDVVVFLNNDTVVTPGWIGRTRALLAADPRRGAVGPRSNSVGGEQILLPVPYTPDLDGLDAFAAGRAEALAGVGRETDRLVGFCLAVTREALERVGGFDPRFGSGNFEDDDLCLRLRLAGYVLWLADDVFVHHYGSRTFAGEGVDYARSLDENWRIFADKWGIAADEWAAGGYDPASIMARAGAFDPARHAVRLTAGWLPELEIEGAGRRNLLLAFDPDGEGWQDALLAFAGSFSAGDGVSLLAYAPGADASAAAERLLAVLGDAKGGTAEIVLVDGPVDPSALVWHADAWLAAPAAPPDVAAAARRTGLRTIDDPTSAALPAILAS